VDRAAAEALRRIEELLDTADQDLPDDAHSRILEQEVLNLFGADI
jgi:hypothetical protein